MAVADPLAIRLQYSPHRPEPPQHAFLWLNDLEALYGGAAGGGKSDALIMAALQYVDVPRYAALLLRRTFPELTQADGLITRSHLWLAGTDATYNAQEHTWKFPSGARLQFGYLQTRWDHLRYQGGAYQFIGFDELTQFLEAQYRYLLSRLRRPSELEPSRHAPPTVERAGAPDEDDPLSRVPLRMRGATNPGGPGHEWVKRRFIEWEEHPDEPEDPDNTLEAFHRRIFIPAKLDDNPHLDRDTYRRSLAGLPRVDREQLEHGLWDVDTGDRVYPRMDVAAGLELGLELDRQADLGRLPPPADTLGAGIDWGEHTHGLIGYPLLAGGFYVVAGVELHAVEVGQSTTTILDLAQHLPAWPGRVERQDPATLLGVARYDPGSAGAQSIRTFRAVARHRHPRLKTQGIAFNSYKREAIDYIKVLLERSRAILDGQRDPAEGGYLAISARAPILRRQLPRYAKDPETGEPIKEDDHGPDALVALVAPTARKYRDRGEADRRKAAARAQRARTLPRA